MNKVLQRSLLSLTLIMCFPLGTAPSHPLQSNFSSPIRIPAVRKNLET